MDDPIDRVFSHALNLVGKVRTGPTKPPAETRLQLYGLYKQSMEGDVEPIMGRPIGRSAQVEQAQEKWDAWKEQEGLSRTAAKCRYIDALITALNLYVDDESGSRDLVSELDFVWNQVKANVSVPTDGSAVSPNSLDSDHESEKDVFEDAVDSNLVGPIRTYPDRLHQLDRSALFRDHDNLPGSLPAGSSTTSEHMPIPPPSNALVGRSGHHRSRSRSANRVAGPSDRRWRSRVENALEQLTAEVAALREQLQLQRARSGQATSFPGSLLSRILPWPLASRAGRLGWFGRFVRWSVDIVWMALKHAAINALILGVLVTYLRRRALSPGPLMAGLLAFPFSGGRPIEEAIRAFVGDAVAATTHHVGRSQGRITDAVSSFRPVLAGKSAVFPSAVSMSGSTRRMSGLSSSASTVSSLSSLSSISSLSSSLSSTGSLNEL